MSEHLSVQNRNKALASPAQSGPVVLHEWTARKTQPVVIGYVLMVFLGFILLAHFVFRSPEAVTALFLAAIGSTVPLVPMVLSRTEHRMTEAGLEKRERKKGEAAPFKPVFAWEELSHVVPIRHGFKYYKPIGEGGWLVRFWKAHLSDRFSGEVQVEAEDRERILEMLTQKGIPTK
jgi:hypothetical protein